MEQEILELLKVALSSVRSSDLTYFLKKMKEKSSKLSPKEESLKEYDDWLYDSFDQCWESFEKSVEGKKNRILATGELSLDQMEELKEMAKLEVFDKKILLKMVFIFPWSEIYSSSLSVEEKVKQYDLGSLWIAGSCSQNAFNEAFKERFAPFSHVMNEFKKAQI